MIHFLFMDIIRYKLVMKIYELEYCTMKNKVRLYKSINNQKGGSMVDKT